MDCQRCTYVLDDPERALIEASSWNAIDDCCRETLELAKLEHGLRRLMPIEQPALELDAKILLAASRRAPATALGARAPLPAVGTSGTSWISRLRHWVTAPQVAMATVTALAVVIGVFYVPSQRMAMEADGDTVMSVPSESPEPAASGSASAPFVNGLPPKPDGVGANAPTTAARPTSASSAVPSDRLASANTGDLADDAPEAAFGGVGRSSEGERDAPGHRADDMLALAESEAAPDEMPREAREEAHGGAAFAPAPMARMASRSAEPIATATTAPATTGGARATLMPSAMTASPTAPSAPSAASPTATSPVGPSSAEVLAQARSLRARGQCAAAAPLYERYLADSTSGARGEATLELAQCLVATGHSARARQLYERATAMPAVASRARASLDAMGADSSDTGSAAGRAPAGSAPAASSRARAGSSAAEAAPSSESLLDAY